MICSIYSPHNMADVKEEVKEVNIPVVELPEVRIRCGRCHVYYPRERYGSKRNGDPSKQCKRCTTIMRTYRKKTKVKVPKSSKNKLIAELKAKVAALEAAIEPNIENKEATI
jgi:hypothetical protein